METKILKSWHDADLISVENDSIANRLLLKVRREDGSKEELILNGCRIFRMDNFTYQNIISEGIIFNGGYVDSHTIEKKIGWATSGTDSSSYLKHEVIQHYADEVMLGHLSLLVVVPSCGAELVALFESVN